MMPASPIVTSNARVAIGPSFLVFVPRCSFSVLRSYFRTCVGVEIGEDVLNCREEVVGPARIGVERVRVPERREVRAAFAVRLDPRETVVLIGAGARRA